MKPLQIYRLLLTAIPVLAVLLLFELPFAFDEVTSFLEEWVSSGSNVYVVYALVFFVMYLQGTVLPIPAYIPLNAAVQAGLIETGNGLWPMFGDPKTWILFAVVLFAYLLGVITAYFLGYFLGVKAVKWIASSEEDYEKWSSLLSGKGKWFYFLTVLLPVFPDDLLCLVCGSLRMNFLAFFLSNVVGRSIGLVFMIGGLALLKEASGDIPWALIAWSLALLVSIVLALVYRAKLRKEGLLPPKK